MKHEDSSWKTSKFQQSSRAKTRPGGQFRFANTWSFRGLDGWLDLGPWNSWGQTREPPKGVQNAIAFGTLGRLLQNFPNSAKRVLCGEFYRTNLPKRWHPNDLTNPPVFLGGNMLLFWSYQHRRKHIIQVNTVAIWIYLISDLFHRFVLAKAQQCFSFSKFAFQHW